MKDDATLICIENATENAALTNGERQLSPQRVARKSSVRCGVHFGRHNLLAMAVFF